MSRDLKTKVFFYPILAVLTLVRKPVLWIVLVIAGGVWWFQQREAVEAVEDGNALMDATISTPTVPMLTVEPLVTPAIPGVANQDGEPTKAQEFTFPPDFTEAVLARFRMQEKKDATSWDDLKNAGVVSNVPAPPSGFKFVFDAEFGLLEMVKE